VRLCTLRTSDSFSAAASSSRVTIRPVFPGHVLFLAFVRASGRVFSKLAVCPGFWPNPQVHSNVAIAKEYDGMRQRKLVSFQYKMSVTSQNATLVVVQVHVY